jgi:fructose-1,6-bisphosphatase II
MDRKFVMEYVRVTEAAAIACSTMVGHGRKAEADALAVAAMRRGFDRVPVRGTVVIGEGEMDEAPMLYIGEKVGPDLATLPEFDIAVDPLEGTNLCAEDRPGAIAVLAVAGRGHLLHAPDMYMDKIATGPAGRGVVSLDASAADNVRALAKALDKSVDRVRVVVLARPRHDRLVAELRAVGARVMLISDGDVAPAVAAGLPDTDIDMVLGIGGAPEGVLAAAALRCLDGEFQGRLAFTEPGQRERAIAMGIADPDRRLARDEIVRGDCLFVATGVTTGPFLRGVRRVGEWFHLHSVALRSDSGTIRFVETSTRARHLDLPADLRLAGGE